jgi:hypothetical protein
MIIDVEPQIELATGMWRIVCDTYNEPRFVVRQENGEQFTTVFSPKQLDEFIPSKKASEMLKCWEEGVSRKINEIEVILAQGWHMKSRVIILCDIFTKKDLYYKKGGELVYRELETPLSKDDKEYYKRELGRLKAQRGKLMLVKMV